MLIPVLSVDNARHGGVKVGSNNLGGGNAFNPMSAAARLYWPHQQQKCWHRIALNGHGTVLVDEDLKLYHSNDGAVLLRVWECCCTATSTQISTVADR
jgi:hypothetical protein